MRDKVRAAGFAVAAVAAVAVFIVFTANIPTSTQTLPNATQYETLISDALDADRLNNMTTESAPQQQVVNGWTARDLLIIIAKENVDILRAQGAVVDATGTLQTTPFDTRVPGLLLIAILALCWHALTAPKYVGPVPAENIPPYGLPSTAQPT